MATKRTDPQTDRDQIVQNDITHLLASIPGEDITREGLQDTPKRVAKVMNEIFAGYKEDPAVILEKQFDVEEWEYDDVSGGINVANIEFFSVCEHHMLPFFGTVTINYTPGTKVVGLSKFVRLVQCFSRRLQIQERMTQQIADAIYQNTDCQSVRVTVNARHLCMEMRGARTNATTNTTTSATRTRPLELPF